MPVSSIQHPLPRLAASESHVWHANLDAAATGELRALLSDDEIARAERYHFTRHRNRYIAARGTLRTILGGYLECAPEKIVFECGEFGKPQLKGLPLHFNVSHSGAEFLAAVARQEVGIDIERIRNDIKVLEIAETCFSTHELTRLELLPFNEQTLHFFESWTRTEALSKGIGTGLAHELKVETGGEWTVQKLAAPEGYIAAIAMRGNQFAVSYFEAP